MSDEDILNIEPYYSGRPGITQDDVLKAMLELEGKGVKTSVRKILDALGKGSMSTIVKHRNAILAERIAGSEDLPEAYEAMDIGQTLNELTFKLYEQLSTEVAAIAERDVEKIYTNCGNEVDKARVRAEQAIGSRIKMEHEVDGAKNEITLLKSQNKDDKKEIDSLKKQLEKLTEKHHDAQLNHSKTEVTFTEKASAHAATIKALEESMKALRVDTSKQFSIAEKSLASSNEHYDALKMRFDESNDTLITTRKSEADLTSAYAALQANNKQLEVSNKQLAEQVSSTQIRVDEIQQENGMLFKQIGELQGIHKAELLTHQVIIKEKDARIDDLKNREKRL